REKVKKALDRAEIKVMNQAGGMVRLTAQRSMKDAPKKQPVALQVKKRGRKAKQRPDVSPPGSPPYARKKLLKKGIFYAFVPAEHTTFVGPALLNAKSAGIAPGILERGGKETLTDKKGKSFSATYKPRPYMGPALDKNATKIAGLWAGTVK